MTDSQCKRLQPPSVWRKEPLCLALVPAQTATDAEEHLSTLVLTSTGYYTIRYGPEAVGTLGMRMPHGIGPESQAFLRVIQVGKQYSIWCCYVEGGFSLLLWQQEGKPRWCRHHTEVVDNDQET